MREPRSQALQIRQQILRVEQQIVDLNLEYTRLQRGEEYALEVANKKLNDRFGREKDILGLQRDQALANAETQEDLKLIDKLFEKRLKLLNNQLSLERLNNEARIAAIKLEKELLDIKARQSTDKLAINLNRNIDDVSRRIDSPFGGREAEQLDLATEQARRYEDALMGIAEAIEIQEKIRDNTKDADVMEAAVAEIGRLEDKLQVYKELLPVLDEVERQELQLQQNLQQLQPFTDAFARGLTDVFTGLVDGTQSVEEAFSRMLKAMGQALIEQASVMIAQYIAIGIARAFAFGSSPTPKTPTKDIFDTALKAGAAYSQGGQILPNNVALVGENGPELITTGNDPSMVINAERTNNLLNQYSPANAPSKSSGGNGEQSGERMSDLPIPINIKTGPIIQNGNDQYVSRNDFEAGLVKATQEGAKQGEIRALQRLRMNPATRRKVGI